MSIVIAGPEIQFVAFRLKDVLLIIAFLCFAKAFNLIFEFKDYWQMQGIELEGST